jgi:hypothetical protein
MDELRAWWLPLGALLLPDAEVLEESRSSVRTSQLDHGDDACAAIALRERPER